MKRQLRSCDELSLESEQAFKVLCSIPIFTLRGLVTDVLGVQIKSTHFGASIGDQVLISQDSGKRSYFGTVAGFSDKRVMIAPLSRIDGLQSGAPVEVVLRNRCAQLPLGSVVNGTGDSLFITSSERATTDGIVLHNRVDERTHNFISEPSKNEPCELQAHSTVQQFLTGIPAIDLFTPLAKGQRIGVFSDAGVGKTSLLNSICNFAGRTGNVVILALIGERKREITEFILNGNENGTANQRIVVASQADDTPAMRIEASRTAMQAAEEFAKKGRDVVLLIDSITRLVRAYRELGLSCGEAPVRHGYPSSAFSELPRLIERAGPVGRGSITLIGTVLQSGDLNEDPFVEETKSLTDGHIVLTRELAESGQFPAVDLLQSLSRFQSKLLSVVDLKTISYARKILSDAQRDRELIILGGLKDRETLLTRANLIYDLVSTNIPNQHSTYCPEQLFKKLAEITQASP